MTHPVPDSETNPGKPDGRSGLRRFRGERILRSIFLLVPVVLFILTRGGWSGIPSSSDSGSILPKPPQVKPENLGVPHPTAGVPGTGSETVHVGIYLQNVNDIDIKSSTFLMDFYLWFKWKGEINPTESFEFLNLVDSWSMTRQEVYSEPRVLPDGTKYQVYRIQGKFNRKFDLSAFPLDVQDLAIEIEDFRHQARDVVFLPDQQSTSYNKKLKLPGWLIQGIRGEVETAPYETDFGETGNPARETYSKVSFLMRIARPSGAYLFRLLTPLVIVLLCGFTVFFLDPLYIDSRSTIALTALFSLIALHLTVSADLPQVGYLRLIDKLYNVSYFVTFIILAETIAVVRLWDRGEKEKAHRVDRIFLWGVFALTSVCFVGLLVWN